jgi:hypothetical protein
MTIFARNKCTHKSFKLHNSHSIQYGQNKTTRDYSAMPILDCVDENPSAAESRGSHDETGDNKKI